MSSNVPATDRWQSGTEAGRMGPSSFQPRRRFQQAPERERTDVGRLDPRSARSTVRLKKVMWITLGLTMLVALVAATVAVAGNPRSGLLTFLIGAALVMLANPVIWAAVVHGIERDESDEGVAPVRHGEDAIA